MWQQQEQEQEAQDEWLLEVLRRSHLTSGTPHSWGATCMKCFKNTHIVLNVQFFHDFTSSITLIWRKLFITGGVPVPPQHPPLLKKVCKSSFFSDDFQWSFLLAVSKNGGVFCITLVNMHVKSMLATYAPVYSMPHQAKCMHSPPSVRRKPRAGKTLPCNNSISSHTIWTGFISFDCC